MYEILRLIKSDFSAYFRPHKSLSRKWKCILLLPMAFHNPGMIFSVLFRIEHYLFVHPLILIKMIGYLFYPIYYFLTYYVLDFDIHPLARIGQGMYIHNKGVIVSYCKIGHNAKLIGPLTIGLNLVNNGKYAEIGNNVTICTGARVIGDVKIGNNVIIGANAVVVKDIINNVVVGGIPAKIIKPYKL